MLRAEVGRMHMGNVVLVEYESTDEENPLFFIQSGAAGFNATKEELQNLYGVLNYWFNMDSIMNCVIQTNSVDTEDEEQ
jgi:hypothetical protein